MLGLGAPCVSHAVSDITIAEIDPDRSTFDPIDPDAASGGRSMGSLWCPEITITSMRQVNGADCTKVKIAAVPGFD